MRRRVPAIVSKALATLHALGTSAVPPRIPALAPALAPILIPALLASLTAGLASCDSPGGVPVSGRPTGGPTFERRIAGIEGPTVLADDYPSLQAAINAVSATGGIVRLAVRTYAVASPLRIPGGVALVGPGPQDGMPVLRLQDGADVDVLTNVSAGRDRDIRLAHFIIDGNRQAQTLRRHGMNFYGVDGLTIEGVQVLNCSGDGILLQQGTRNVWIRDTTASGNGYTSAWAASGINVEFSSDILIENSTCSVNNGFRDGSSGTPWDGNGIRLGDGTSRARVRNCYFEGNGRRGVKVQSSDNQVLDSTFRGNLGHGSIALHHATDPVERNLVRGNDVEAVYDAGVVLEDNARFNILEGNSIRHAPHGFDVGRNAKGNVFRNNRVSDVTNTGFMLRAGTQSRLIGNTVTGSGLAGIYIGYPSGMSSGDVIVRNVVTDNARGLVMVDGADHATIVGNDFRRNSVYGLAPRGAHTLLWRNKR